MGDSDTDGHQLGIDTARVWCGSVIVRVGPER